ncbi:MAG: hydrogen peroxide-inducible genes activator [Myxococcales bacterium]|nr:hydrogen peroxide-inducible genes activator [Myxococcales bacterium]
MLDELKHLCLVAETGTFTEAARQAHLSQPALSASIKRLEEQIGARLLDRGRRGAQLTAAGEALLPRARAMLADADAFGETAHALGAPLTGPLRLGVIPTIGPYLLPRVLPALRKDFPELQLFLREDLTSRLVAALDAGELDVLLLAVDVDLGDLESLPLFSDPFVLAVPAGDTLAGCEGVGLESLAGRDVLLLEEGHCLRDQIVPLCATSGADESSGFRGTSLGTISQMVASGLGVTLLPELALERELAGAHGLATAEFGPEGPSRSIGLAWRKSSPRAEEFRALGATLAAAYARC